jgi:hypothetical protein
MMLEFCRTVNPNLQDYEADGVRANPLHFFSQSISLSIRLGQRCLTILLRGKRASWLMGQNRLNDSDGLLFFLSLFPLHALYCPRNVYNIPALCLSTKSSNCDRDQVNVTPRAFTRLSCEILPSTT